MNSFEHLVLFVMFLILLALVFGWMYMTKAIDGIHTTLKEIEMHLRRLPSERDI